MNNQAGFTLIELIMVIVIIGILAAVAVPKFVDLSGQAQQSATIAQAANLGSAVTMNFANKRVSGSGTAVHDCATSSSLVNGFDSGEYTITGTFSGTSLGDTTTCTVTDTGSNTATFTGIYVP